MAERFGGKWVIGIAIFICYILSFISPLVARSGGYGPLMGVRLMMGLAQVRFLLFIIMYLNK